MESYALRAATTLGHTTRLLAELLAIRWGAVDLRVQCIERTSRQVHVLALANTADLLGGELPAPIALLLEEADLLRDALRVGISMPKALLEPSISGKLSTPSGFDWLIPLTVEPTRDCFAVITFVRSESTRVTEDSPWASIDPSIFVNRISWVTTPLVEALRVDSRAGAFEDFSVAASLPGVEGLRAAKLVLETDLQDLETVTRRHIRTALQACAGRIEGLRGAAHVLKISPQALRARMRKLGIERSAFR